MVEATTGDSRHLGVAVLALHCDRRRSSLVQD
jgi:hypothetical protein